VSRVERRQHKRRRRRGLLVMVLLLVAAAGVVSQALRLTADRQRKVPAGQPVTVTVSRGQSSVEIGRTLTDTGVVDSVGRFRSAAEERGLDGLLKPGTYQLVTGMDVDAVLEVLAKGPSTGVPFTIPEGYTVAQIVDEIAETRKFSRAELKKALESKRLIAPYRPKKVTSLEGMLFPDTYAIEPDDTAVSVLQDMLDQLGVVMTRYEHLSPPLKLSTYQLLIVASMIEREAKVPADRPKVATVIYNRLRDGHRLQVDATVEYAVGHRRLSARDLQSGSPYNTYRFAGLPPTPIAAPGEASIRAALQPAPGNWRYYVLISKEGEHAFTDSYQEFQQLKAEAKAKGLL
jgi:UPF0755 protein